MTDGSSGTSCLGHCLEDPINDMMDANSAERGTFGSRDVRNFHRGTTGQIVRLIAWSGNGLTSAHKDMRLRGTEPGDDGEVYVKLTKKVRKQVRRLEDLHVELAGQQGTYMVVFGLGDGASWGLDPSDSSYGALNVFASKVAAYATG